MKPALSIVIPTLNEAASIEATLRALQPLRARGVELVLADGGSGDTSVAVSRPWVDAVVDAPRGGALQMNAGAAQARADALLFLHADTRLQPLGDVLVSQALANGAFWGRFDVRIEGRPWMLRVIAAMMNLRSRLSGIATGDQAIFVTRLALERVGGFPAQPLMEDIEISRPGPRLPCGKGCSHRGRSLVSGVGAALFSMCSAGAHGSSAWGLRGHLQVSFARFTEGCGACAHVRERRRS